MSADNLTILVAIAAGLLSFLSPCVLPLVPAYIGQLTAVAVAGPRRSADGAADRASAVALDGLPPRARLRRGVRGRVHAARRHRDVRVGRPVAVDAGPAPGRRRHPRPARSEPRRRAPDPALDRTGGRSMPARRRPSRRRPGRCRSRRPAAPGSATGSAAGSSSSRGGWLASFGLGAIFAIGWTPCIGVILGGILGLASSSTTVGQGAILLVAYTPGSGCRSSRSPSSTTARPALLRPLVRHGRAVSVIGGLLVVAIGAGDDLQLAGPPRPVRPVQLRRI